MDFMNENMDDVYVYVRIRYGVIEAKPFKVEPRMTNPFGFIPDCYKAYFDHQVYREEKRGDCWSRILSYREGELKNNAVWFHGKNMDKARKVFYADIMKRYNEINKKFDDILEEKERFERGE